jgi:hypothetical protein
MSAPIRGGTLLDEGAAAFLYRPGISITAASRDDRNVPRIGRCLGCRITADRNQVTVLIASAQYRVFFEALAASRTIAVVYSLPSTHRTLQLKGVDGAAGPLAPGDAELAARHVESFVEELGALGYNRDMVRTAHWCDVGELQAVTFTPSAAFEQTPGPGAGAPLRRAA